MVPATALWMVSQMDHGVARGVHGVPDRAGDTVQVTLHLVDICNQLDQVPKAALRSFEPTARLLQVGLALRPFLNLSSFERRNNNLAPISGRINFDFKFASRIPPTCWARVVKSKCPRNAEGMNSLTRANSSASSRMNNHSVRSAKLGFDGLNDEHLVVFILLRDIEQLSNVDEGMMRFSRVSACPHRIA